jgi:hypothetical protein
MTQWRRKQGGIMVQRDGTIPAPGSPVATLGPVRPFATLALTLILAAASPRAAHSDEEADTLARLKDVRQLVKDAEYLLEFARHQVGVADALTSRANAITRELEHAGSFEQREALHEAWRREIIDVAVRAGGVAKHRRLTYDPPAQATFLRVSTIPVLERRLAHYRESAAHWQVRYEGLQRAGPARTGPSPR